MSKVFYKDYFNIDPKYYAAVTEDLINNGQVKWESYYPHETFVKLLEKTHKMLSGRDSRSLWLEGAYGTGKSHAALTIKSMLEASDEQIRAYFDDYGLDKDLCQKLITDKNNGKLITIHRIGSASIRSDQDLILAIQDSVTDALNKHGIVNKGEASLREVTLKWLRQKERNKVWFNDLINDEEYLWDFGGKSVDDVMDILQNSTDNALVSKLMRSILKVATENGITALRMDIPAMCRWIKSIIDNNDEISAILFVWDEFTEFFINNLNSLTGFQTLAEISQSHPFYFLIVTHESGTFIKDQSFRRKIFDRFVDSIPVGLALPENMAFRLMAQAMKTTKDYMLSKEWDEYKADLNDELSPVRNSIITTLEKKPSMGIVSDSELMAIVPIHPYAALLLKHMSVVFNSNARSMFDFIISNDTTDAKAFKWFIQNYGPLDSDALLTVDMLWDFFTARGQSGLNDDVRVILDSFNLLKKGSLTPDQERVFKTVLLLEAVSVREKEFELLRPNEQNIDLAFCGTDWPKGKARSIVNGLCKEMGLLFEQPVGKGLMEYTVARIGDLAKIEKLKEEIKNSLKAQDLVVNAKLLDAVKPPAPISMRYSMVAVTAQNFNVQYSRENNNVQPNRFKAFVLFGLNDTDISNITSSIQKNIVMPKNNLFFIQSLVPMGEDSLNEYIKSMAYSKNNRQSNKKQADGFQNQAEQYLESWKQRIVSGAFMLYTPEHKSGIRVANLVALNDELVRINRQMYFCGLEQYNLIDNMFLKGPVAQGAECGIKQELRGTFSSSNVHTSLKTALRDVWQVENYWKDPSKRSLPIVRIKNKVDEVIKAGFESPSGRVSILSIYEALEGAPFGFMPSNVTAFVLGFVLKEYATSDYFWSNSSNNESMSIDKMKQMIANAINQKYQPNSRYKEEYIVAMSVSQRSFLNCTSKAFNIPLAQCGSVESARDNIRIKMKGLTFPIWCLKYVFNSVSLDTPHSDLETVIDAYCGIANTANSNRNSESELADIIGNIAHSSNTLEKDLKQLLTNEMCRKGMLAYIKTYRNGLLCELALKIGDSGAYIEQVKQKFNADAANWVWNSVTADEKISDVILEYQIIFESNKILPLRCTTIREVENEWNKHSNNIRIPYDVLRKYVGDLSQLLQQLLYIKQSGHIQEQNKKKFLDTLIAQREMFGKFYKEQLQCFIQATETFIDDFDDQDKSKFFNTIPTGQFTKTSTDYYRDIEKRAEDYRRTLKTKQLEDLWRDKTGTKNPDEWSSKYSTPILCMFSDSERSEAKEIFSIMLSHSNTDANISRAISYLNNATFFDFIDNPLERDECFKQRVIGEYAIMLDDVDSVRRSLLDHITDKPYNWMDNSTVKNYLKKLAEKQYRLSGCKKAMSVIDRMDASQLRHYLSELITDNLTVGLEILKNN